MQGCPPCSEYNPQTSDRVHPWQHKTREKKEEEEEEAAIGIVFFVGGISVTARSRPCNAQREMSVVW